MGPVYPGSAAGDFNIIKLTDRPGWVVTGHHPDILNYVSPDEFEEDEPTEVAIGLLGRGKRDADSRSLNIVHIEDKRNFSGE